MAQLHKRFSDVKIVLLLQANKQGLMSRDAVQDALSIGGSRLFELLKTYGEDHVGFSFA
jgi:hypothetical protein